MNDLNISVNGATGMVTVTLHKRNGIALAKPETLEIPIDMWVMAACKIIESGINERANQMRTIPAGSKRNGFEI